MIHTRPTSCYACAVDISGRGQKLAKMQFRWDLYEKMVEFLETLPAGSIIKIPWLAREAYDWDAGIPDRYAVARLVVRDMYYHKILRPRSRPLGRERLPIPEGAMRFNAYWADCTPEWVSTYNACGETVRRLKLEWLGDEMRPAAEPIGHEHLMAMPGMSPFPVPIDHRSGEPA